jgi:hypothetical protein
MLRPRPSGTSTQNFHCLIQGPNLFLQAFPPVSHRAGLSRHGHQLLRPEPEVLLLFAPRLPGRSEVVERLRRLVERLADPDAELGEGAVGDLPEQLLQPFAQRSDANTVLKKGVPWVFVKQGCSQTLTRRSIITVIIVDSSLD